jgi:RNA polymerase sigma factor (sigma-70 family)
MRAVPIPANVPAVRPLGSKRLLALAGDQRLVEQIRRGNEAAFEVAFERHSASVLAFCRHMLGSREEAEDAVQHTFAAAFRDLERGGERHIVLRPWLFAIARNRCVSLLRARREHPVEDPVLATAGLAEQVEQRAEVRRLLDDLRELPDEQRAALLLTEVGDLSHADAAGVLGCGVPRVKALVYRARSGLIARREARARPCDEIREQLANLRGGSLRRTELRLHLRECPGCRAYRDEVKRQRELLAVALPVVPTLGLKSSVLAAAGIGGASAGGGAAVAGGLAGAFGGAGLAKIAAVATLAGAGVAGGQAVVESGSTPASSGGASVDGGGVGDGAAGVGVSARGRRLPATAPDRPGSTTAPDRPGRGAARDRPASATAPDRPGQGVGRFMSPDRTKKRPTPSGAAPRGQLKSAPGRKTGHSKRAVPDETAPGRGQARGREAAGVPPAKVPVRRGPPDASKQQGRSPAKAQSAPAKPGPKAKTTAPRPVDPNPGAPKPKPR